VDDLFTIISIVIAVSGATYAALVAIREYLGGSVRERLKVASDHSEKMRDATNDTHKTRASRFEGWLVQLNRAWMLSYGVPILIFAVISYCQAIHIIVAYWGNPATKPPSGWPVYKWVLIAMTAVDALCIVATLAAYGLIRYVCNEVKENHDAEFASKAEALRPADTGEVSAAQA
jgi:hypothetical protein